MSGVALGIASDGLAFVCLHNRHEGCSLPALINFLEMEAMPRRMRGCSTLLSALGGLEQLGASALQLVLAHAFVLVDAQVKSPKGTQAEVLWQQRPGISVRPTWHGQLEAMGIRHQAGELVAAEALLLDLVLATRGTGLPRDTAHEHFDAAARAQRVECAPGSFHRAVMVLHDLHAVETDHVFDFDALHFSQRLFATALTPRGHWPLPVCSSTAPCRRTSVTGLVMFRCTAPFGVHSAASSRGLFWHLLRSAGPSPVVRFLGPRACLLVLEDLMGITEELLWRAPRGEMTFAEAVHGTMTSAFRAWRQAEVQCGEAATPPVQLVIAIGRRVRSSFITVMQQNGMREVRRAVVKHGGSAVDGSPNGRVECKTEDQAATEEADVAVDTSRVGSDQDAPPASFKTVLKVVFDDDVVAHHDDVALGDAGRDDAVQHALDVFHHDIRQSFFCQQAHAAETRHAVSSTGVLPPSHRGDKAAAALSEQLLRVAPNITVRSHRAEGARNSFKVLQGCHVTGLRSTTGCEAYDRLARCLTHSELPNSSAHRAIECEGSVVHAEAGACKSEAHAPGTAGASRPMSSIANTFITASAAPLSTSESSSVSRERILRVLLTSELAAVPGADPPRRAVVQEALTHITSIDRHTIRKAVAALAADGVINRVSVGHRGSKLYGVLYPADSPPFTRSELDRVLVRYTEWLAIRRRRCAHLVPGAGTHPQNGHAPPSSCSTAPTLAAPTVSHKGPSGAVLLPPGIEGSMSLVPFAQTGINGTMGATVTASCLDGGPSTARSSQLAASLAAEYFTLRNGYEPAKELRALHLFLELWTMVHECHMTHPQRLHVPSGQRRVTRPYVALRVVDVAQHMSLGACCRVLGLGVDLSQVFDERAGVAVPWGSAISRLPSELSRYCVGVAMRGLTDALVYLEQLDAVTLELPEDERLASLTAPSTRAHIRTVFDLDGSSENCASSPLASCIVYVHASVGAPHVVQIPTSTGEDARPTGGTKRPRCEVSEPVGARQPICTALCDAWCKPSKPAEAGVPISVWRAVDCSDIVSRAVHVWRRHHPTAFELQVPVESKVLRIVRRIRIAHESLLSAQHDAPADVVVVTSGPVVPAVDKDTTGSGAGDGGDSRGGDGLSASHERSGASAVSIESEHAGAGGADANSVGMCGDQEVKQVAGNSRRERVMPSGNSVDRSSSGALQTGLTFEQLIVLGKALRTAHRRLFRAFTVPLSYLCESKGETFGGDGSSRTMAARHDAGAVFSAKRPANRAVALQRLPVDSLKHTGNLQVVTAIVWSALRDAMVKRDCGVVLSVLKALSRNVTGGSLSPLLHCLKHHSLLLEHAVQLCSRDPARLHGAEGAPADALLHLTEVLIRSALRPTVAPGRPIASLLPDCDWMGVVGIVPVAVGAARPTEDADRIEACKELLRMCLLSNASRFSHTAMADALARFTEAEREAAVQQLPCLTLAKMKDARRCGYCLRRTIDLLPRHYVTDLFASGDAIKDDAQHCTSAMNPPDDYSVSASAAMDVAHVVFWECWRHATAVHMDEVGQVASGLAADAIACLDVNPEEPMWKPGSRRPRCPTENVAAAYEYVKRRRVGNVGDSVDGMDLTLAGGLGADTSFLLSSRLCLTRALKEQVVGYLFKGTNHDSSMLAQLFPRVRAVRLEEWLEHDERSRMKMPGSEPRQSLHVVQGSTAQPARAPRRGDTGELTGLGGRGGTVNCHGEACGKDSFTGNGPDDGDHKTLRLEADQPIAEDRVTPLYWQMHVLEDPCDTMQDSRGDESVASAGTTRATAASISREPVRDVSDQYPARSRLAHVFSKSSGRNTHLQRLPLDEWTDGRDSTGPSVALGARSTYSPVTGPSDDAVQTGRPGYFVMSAMRHMDGTPHAFVLNVCIARVFDVILTKPGIEHRQLVKKLSEESGGLFVETHLQQACLFLERSLFIRVEHTCRREVVSNTASADRYSAALVHASPFWGFVDQTCGPCDVPTCELCAVVDVCRYVPTYQQHINPFLSTWRSHPCV